MRSTASVLLILLLAGLGCVSCRTRNSFVSWTPEEGHAYLVNARRFDFGPVGDMVAGTSPGEYACRAVLRSRNAPEIFKSILSHRIFDLDEATDVGKLYALVGIRIKDRAEFEQYAKALTDIDGKVTVYANNIGETTVAFIVNQIRDGHYDGFGSAW